RHPGEEDLGRRLVRVVLEEVVLGRPVVLEPGGVAGERHLDLAHVPRMLVVPRRNVHLREDPEFHRRPPGNPDRPRIRCCELPFANTSCQPFFRVVASPSCLASPVTKRAKPAPTSTASTSWRPPKRSLRTGGSRWRRSRRSRLRPAS